MHSYCTLPKRDRSLAVAVIMLVYYLTSCIHPLLLLSVLLSQRDGSCDGTYLHPEDNPAEEELTTHV